MKNLLVTAAVVLASAGAALASTGYTTLPSSDVWQIESVAPNADLSNLTTSQYARFVSLFSESDNAGNDTAGQIKSILSNP
jgi:hypothetical protein